MEIIRDYRDVKDTAQGAVLAVGNFDGVHKGHRALIAKAAAIAAESGLRLAALTFEPHPRRLFRPDDPPFSITPFPVKARILGECGIDTLFALTFDWDFASRSAEDFIETVLRRGLAPAHIVVGYDFRFGQLRKGSPDTIIQAGLAVTVLEAITDEDGTPCSSSAIRAALRHGDMETAQTLLGRPWEIEGTVAQGDKRGRELGFPTANVHLGETIHPAYGVYAARIHIEGEADWRPAAVNIGIRPMFEIPVGQVEAHILDFDGDIYGRTLRVRPVRRLRGEARFGSLDALIAQIGQDCADVRTALLSSK